MFYSQKSWHGEDRRTERFPEQATGTKVTFFFWALSASAMLPPDEAGPAVVSRLFSCAAPPLIADMSPARPGGAGGAPLPLPPPLPPPLSSALLTLFSVAPPEIEPKKLSLGAPGGGPTLGAEEEVGGEGPEESRNEGRKKKGKGGRERQITLQIEKQM